MIALIAGGVAADDGATQPAHLPLLPADGVRGGLLSPAPVRLVGAFDMVAFVVVGDLYGHPDPT